MIWCEGCGDGDCCERCDLNGCPILCDTCHDQFVINLYGEGSVINVSSNNL